jgi:hypothetical protein
VFGSRRRFLESRQSEIEQLGGPPIHEDIARLDVAVDDAFATK